MRRPLGTQRRSQDWSGLEKFRIGDLVHVAGVGDGHICEVRTFRAKVRMMTPEDAVVFGRDVAARYGAKGHEAWLEVMVSFGGPMRWFESSEVSKR